MELYGILTGFVFNEVNFNLFSPMEAFNVNALTLPITSGTTKSAFNASLTAFKAVLLSTFAYFAVMAPNFC